MGEAADKFRPDDLGDLGLTLAEVVPVLGGKQRCWGSRTLWIPPSSGVARTENGTWRCGLAMTAQQRCDESDRLVRMNFSKAVISTGRSWSSACAGILHYELSLRDLVEMMAERGLSVAHTTIMCWIQYHAPEFENRWSRFARPAGRSWRVDETWSKLKDAGPISIARSTKRERQSISCYAPSGT